ncbi:unnamed protein product [Parajaminaea phylloscopi]
MTSSISRVVAATPLVRDLPLPLQVVAIAAAIVAFAVVLNVANQLLVPKPRSAPPVVFHWFPFIGSAITYGMDPYTFFFECRKKHGDVFTFILLGRKVTVALGPKGSNLVLNGKISEVSAEDVYGAVTTPVFGKDAVYDVPNAVLMEQKRFVKAGLTTENLEVFVGQIVEEVKTFVAKDTLFAPLKQDSSSVTLDIFKTMSQITILTASRTLQGVEVRESLDKTFADLYHDLDAGFIPINFIMPGLPLPGNFRRDRAQKKMSRFYRDIIEKRRAAGNIGGESAEHDMIATLMQQTYKNGRPLTDIEMAHIMIALLMAGQHTSSATGAWALLRLASKPELIQELYDEQVRVYGEGSKGSFRPLDYETNKNSVPVLDSVIRETLRMHPPLHSLMRLVLKDLPVPPTLSASRLGSKQDAHTLVIPKGHSVLAAPGVSAIDPELWPDAAEFKPSRWLEGGQLKADATEGAGGETVDYGWGAVSKAANSPYLPFGAGRHRCIGEQFAYLQLGTIISTFVRDFDWKLDQGKFPEPDYTSMVVLPKPPANIVMTKRA